MPDPLHRRDLIRLAATGLAAGSLGQPLPGIEPSLRTFRESSDDAKPAAPNRPWLTPSKDFNDVSRGDPVPHTLTGEALTKARLTPETWRLEIAAEKKATIEKPLSLAAGTALDFATLLKLGKTHGVKFLKAMQCNNIALPLGQGLWEGVPLREVLKLCGKSTNARRLYFWGFHNDKPEQMFRSSLAMNQVLDSPPGELPPFLAYKLNGEPISLTRGGPVRMVVPWAHGFKSIKWLQKIVLTNQYETNDTYAEQNNDPESYLKTAAYFDNLQEQTFETGQAVTLRGTCMVGWPGLRGVECWVRPDTGKGGQIDDHDPAWSKAEWKAALIDPPPSDWVQALPQGVSPKEIAGFDQKGQAKEWPVRYSIAHWTWIARDLPKGKYEVRVRTIDLNGFAQPEPRPNQRSGKNQIPCKIIEVMR